MNKDIMKSLGFEEEVKAMEAGLCSWCKKEITDFRNEISEREYKISGMCQNCQDKTFGKD